MRETRPSGSEGGEALHCTFPTPIKIICSMKGDVKRKYFPDDGGSWISLASRPCDIESRSSGLRLELDIIRFR